MGNSVDTGPFDEQHLSALIRGWYQHEGDDKPPHADDVLIRLLTADRGERMMRRQPLDIRELQQKLYEWEQRNFGDTTTEFTRLAIVMEEVGEMAHVILKQHQNIRPESTTDEMLRDAIGDIFVTLCNVAIGRGWDLEEIIMDTSQEVLARDWVADRAERAAADGE